LLNIKIFYEFLFGMNYYKTLTSWYLHNKRDLPWRHTSNPYLIWLSETILQQTRINQGINYYLKFVQNYPKLENLAAAPLDEVLKLWQGLGYYSRARNLHVTAQNILYKYKGKFPESYKELLKLKGIGPYTAAAVASIAFNEPVAVVDGNVYRVLARYFNISYPIDSTAGKKYFSGLANKLLDQKNPGNFNQALMEFGALQCIPVKPVCHECPFQHSCAAFEKGIVHKLPVKQKKLKQTNRYFNYLVILKNNHIYMMQRNNKDIWHSLYQFPLIETSEETTLSDLMQHKDWNNLFGNNRSLTIDNTSKTYRHILSHQKIYARFIKVLLNENSSVSGNDLMVVPLPEISVYAVPRLIEKYLFETNLIS
jgi:A/G-specific adenine glycosylase